MVKVAVLRRLPALSLGAILVAVFALGYLFCFVVPVFLNPAQEMVFPRYISGINPIGVDLRLAYEFSKSWITGAAPEIPSLVYPPLERVLRLPLLLFPFRGAFTIQTLITLAAFMSVVLLLPKRISKSPDWTALSGLFLAGLFSYGMQFEIERGQSNVMAMALVAWALVLFHYGRGLSVRLAAYLLFSCAIQLKLYPAVFVLGFTKDARDWRRNMMRWVGLGAANVAGLFALGWDAFCAFLSTLTTHSGGYAGFGNHSLLSFSSVIQKLADGYKPRHYCPGEVAAASDRIRAVFPEAWLAILGPAVGLAFTVILLGSLALILVMAYHRNDRAAFKYVIVVCALVGLLVPGVSMDYKLTVLILVFAFFVSESGPIVPAEKRGMLRAGLFFAVCLLFTLTLFPAEFRPLALRSSTPLLVAMAFLFTVLMALEKRSTPGEENFPADQPEGLRAAPKRAARSVATGNLRE